MSNGQDPDERLVATVRGLVQGVGYRWFVVRQASALKLTGWARNERDGSVHVVAEGTRPALDELVARLHQGPPSSQVADVLVERLPPSGEFRSFRIRSGDHRGD